MTEHSQKGVTDGQTDGRTDWTIHRAAWSQLTIEHLFYATSSFVNNFKAIGEFELEWQSGNAQFRSKSAIFVPGDLEISRMTLKNNMAPLLCYFKIWASFHSHRWIRTGVTVRKRPIPLKISDICPLWFHGWPWKITWHLFYATSKFEHHFIAICEFELELQSEKSQLWVKIDNFFLALWPWIWRITLKNNRALSSMLLQTVCIIS